MERIHTPHFLPDRGPRRPSAIVVHTTVGTSDSTISWFTNPASKVSAHYLVGLDGHLVQFVDEKAVAFHAGVVHSPSVPLCGPNPNLYTIGIEFEDGGAPFAAARHDEQYVVGGRLIGEIAGRWGIPVDRHHVIAHRQINGNKGCPGNLDIGRLIREASRRPAERLSSGVRAGNPGQARIVCLLPVRNGADDLPGWLASVSRFADSVIALDDGSTDDTAEILRRHPIVKALLTNPRRDTYRGWDDSGNRNRLLRAAGQIDGDWVVFLDADERIPADDAAALRRFVATDALPGCAYGFRHFRMWGADACDPDYRWIYRLFAHRPGQTLPAERLHFDPIPQGIARRAWLQTTVRVQHFGAADEHRRLQRLRKYQEADPAGEYPTNFGGLADRPPVVVPWEPKLNQQDLVVVASPNHLPGGNP